MDEFLKDTISTNVEKSFSLVKIFAWKNITSGDITQSFELMENYKYKLLQNHIILCIAIIQFSEFLLNCQSGLFCFPFLKLGSFHNRFLWLISQHENLDIFGPWGSCCTLISIWSSEASCALTGSLVKWFILLQSFLRSTSSSQYLGGKKTLRIRVETILAACFFPCMCCWAAKKM